MVIPAPPYSRGVRGGVAGSDEQFQLVAGAVDRNPEHAEPVAHPRDRDHRQLAAVEDEDLSARRHVDAKDHVGRIERRPPLRDFEGFQATPAPQLLFSIKLASPPSPPARAGPKVW